MRHVYPLAQVVHSHLAPAAACDHRIESCNQIPSRIERQSYDGLELTVVENGQNHDAEHDREAGAANAD